MKKALVYRWKAYNQFDVEEALREAGIDIEIADFPYRSADRDDEFSRKLTERLEEKPYDFVFSVNYFTIISNVCEKCHVKYISWLCDSRLLTMHNQSIFNSCNVIFDFDRVSCAEFLHMGIPVHYLPLAVNTHRLDRVIALADDRDTYAADVSFVGSMYAQKNEYDRVKDKLTPYLQGYFDATLRAQMDVYAEDVVSAMMTPEIEAQLGECLTLDKAEDSFSSLPLVFAVTHLGFKLANLERMELLKELSERFSVKLYSDLASNDLPRVQHCGRVDYWNEMPLVFHESSINLNITMRNIRSGLPLRVFDIMGSGGFLLSNFQAEFPALFEPGKDMVYYESFSDCARKAEYYLDHEDERREIARNGYEKVKRFHSYEQRFRQMFEVVHL